MTKTGLITKLRKRKLSKEIVRLRNERDKLLDEYNINPNNFSQLEFKPRYNSYFDMSNSDKDELIEKIRTKIFYFKGGHYIVKEVKYFPQEPFIINAIPDTFVGGILEEENPEIDEDIKGYKVDNSKLMKIVQNQKDKSSFERVISNLGFNHKLTYSVPTIFIG